jgi:hypothetical protein
MFTKIEADIPIKLPNERMLQHAVLKIDSDTGEVSIEFENFEAANELLHLIRVNNLLSIQLLLEPIEGARRRR